MEHVNIPADRPWAESASAEDMALDLLLADFAENVRKIGHLPVLDSLPEDLSDYPGVMGRALTDEEIARLKGL